MHLSHSYSSCLLSFLGVYIFSTTHFPCLDFFYTPVELQHRSLSYNHLWRFSLVVRIVFLVAHNTKSHCRYCFLSRVTRGLFRNVFLVLCTECLTIRTVFLVAYNTMSLPYCVSCCQEQDVSLSALFLVACNTMYFAYCFLFSRTRCLIVRAVFLVACNTKYLP